MPETVWAGRGSLTEWPERDWFILLHKDFGYEPVWDRQPMTTSMWLARLMTGRDGREARVDPSLARDDGIIRTSGKPQLQNVDLFERVRMALAERGGRPVGEMRLTDRAPEPVQMERIPDTIAVKWAERARETQPVDRPVVLCSLTNKVRHQSKLWALHHRNQLAVLPDERFPERLEVFKCKGGCGDWHVGHRT